MKSDGDSKVQAPEVMSHADKINLFKQRTNTNPAPKEGKQK